MEEYDPVVQRQLKNMRRNLGLDPPEPEPEPDDGLVEASVFSGKEADDPTIVKWVASHLPIKDVRPEDAPSSIAYAMLVWARSTPQNEKEFWNQHYGKWRTWAEAEAAKRQDDGSHVLTLIDRMEKAMADHEYE